jgi:hypothetical protein
MVGAMPVTIWDCHDTFWENRRFVTWQLLRRNQTYQAECERLVKDRSIFLPKRSYPPSSSNERFEFWQQGIELFAEMLMESDKLQYFREAIRYRPIWTSTNQPDQVPFRKWLDRKELHRKIPYKDLFFGQFTRSRVSVPTQKLKDLGLTLLCEPTANNPTCSLMTIFLSKNTVKVIMPFHDRSTESVVFPLLDPAVDFPPVAFLPRVTLTTPTPSPKDRKKYASYLYDQAFEPYATGRGRPRTIKQNLRVWDLSKVQGKKDADIARELFNLQYSYPAKPAALQRVYELKTSAQKDIETVFP